MCFAGMEILRLLWKLTSPSPACPPAPAGMTAAMVAKYRPAMPIMTLVSCVRACVCVCCFSRGLPAAPRFQADRQTASPCTARTALPLPLPPAGRPLPQARRPQVEAGGAARGSPGAPHLWPPPHPGRTHALWCAFYAPAWGVTSQFAEFDMGTGDAHLLSLPPPESGRPCVATTAAAAHAPCSPVRALPSPSLSAWLQRARA